MNNHSSDNKRIARNTLFLYVRMGIVLIISLYTTRVVLKVLGIEDFGIYHVVGGFVSMFGVLTTALTNGINRFYNYKLGQDSSGGVTAVYNAAVRIQVLTAAIVLILIEGIGVWYVNSVMVIPSGRLNVANWLFQFSVVSMLLIVLQAPYSAAVLAYEKMDFFALVSVLDAILKLVICFVVQYFGEDYLLAYGLLMLGISLINFALYFVFTHIKFSEIRLTRHVDKPLFRSMLSFSGWSMLNPIAYTARGQGCNLVLNYYFGTILNAANNVAMQIANAVDQMSNNFSVSFRPQIIQSYASQEYVRTKRLMYSMSKISFLLHALFAIPIILEINNLLELWLGKDSIPEYAAPFACWILLIKWINCLNPPITNVMSATGRIKTINICTACILLSNVPIAILLMALGLSPVAIYIAMLLLTLLNQFVCLRILCNSFPVVTMRSYIVDIVLPSMALSVISLVLPFIVSYFLAPTVWRLLITFASCIVSIGFSCIFYLDKDEKLLAKTMAKSLLNRLFHLTNSNK